MKVEEKCLTCRFWLMMAEEGMGQCRRNAPKPMGWVAGNEDEDHIPRITAVWPETRSTDRCGEWGDVWVR
jgi:hypothetical protein